MNHNSFAEADFAKLLLDFLKEKGYPEESIVYQPILPSKGQRRYRPDFVIVDPEKREYLAIIELKGRLLSERNLQLATNQLQGYARAVEDKAVESFLVTISQSGASPLLVFYRLMEQGDLKEVSTDNFPSFGSLTANKAATEKAYLSQATEETTDRFRVLCFSLAISALGVFVADFILERYGIMLLSAERLTVLGIAIALMIVPFVAKFRGLGIEYERYTGSEPTGKTPTSPTKSE